MDVIESVVFRHERRAVLFLRDISLILVVDDRDIADAVPIFALSVNDVRIANIKEERIDIIFRITRRIGHSDFIHGRSPRASRLA